MAAVFVIIGSLATFAFIVGAVASNNGITEGISWACALLGVIIIALGFCVGGLSDITKALAAKTPAPREPADAPAPERRKTPFFSR